MKTIRSIYHFLQLIWRLNVIKTLYFNFKVLPFRVAAKVPIFIYGKTYIWDISGSVCLPDKVSTGMIKIGYKWFDLWPVGFLPTQIQNRGKLVFDGNVIISGGTNINVQHQKGILKFGNYVCVGGGTIIKCLDHIEIGEGTRITGNCSVMDCNMHFVKNIDTGVVANYKAPIFIGKNCWINYGTVVGKGAVIPNYSISSRNAFISKDFSEYGENLFLVGSPCKPTSSRVQRIFSAELQKKYADYYSNHDEQLQLMPGIEEEIGDRECF